MRWVPRVTSSIPSPVMTVSPVETAPLPVAKFGSKLVAGTAIHGVELRPLKMNFDARGCFTEVFQDHWNSCIKPVQWSVVHSEPNVFRGLHLHRCHDEYISVIVGRASVGLRDVRPWSPPMGRGRSTNSAARTWPASPFRRACCMAGIFTSRPSICRRFPSLISTMVRLTTGAVTGTIPPSRFRGRLRIRILTRRAFGFSDAEDPA